MLQQMESSVNAAADGVISECWESRLNYSTIQVHDSDSRFHWLFLAHASCLVLHHCRYAFKMLVWSKLSPYN